MHEAIELFVPDVGVDYGLDVLRRALGDLGYIEQRISELLRIE
jgi:hypothetical protein